MARPPDEPRVDLRLRRMERRILNRQVVTLRAGAAGSSAAPGVPTACLVSAQGWLS
jgi:hypothetical protein